VASLSTIAVIGATGTAGSRVVARLKARDVAVVEISRRHGVDVVSGRGLFEALAGVDVVIDVSNPLPDRSGITQTVATATRNVVGACAARDVRRLVVSTVAGVEDSVFDGFRYYEAKRAAKAIILDGPVPATIVKSTQWYEFARQGDDRRVRTVQPALGALGTGALLASDGAVIVGPDVDTWLHTLAPAAADGDSPDGDGAAPTKLRDLSKT